MATCRDLISMLEDSGSVKLHHSQGHIHYRLPNGNRFITSSTPGDHRSYINAMSILRRELRQTHPEIAERGRSLPKSKRASVTLGEYVSIKGLGFMHHTKAIPGSEPVRPPEVEFEVLPPEPEPVLESLEVPIPRKPRAEPIPYPGKARTLSPEQLQMANSILKSDGEQAMNEFLSKCRCELIPASAQITLDRQPSSAPSPIPQIYDEDHEMANILERARAELTATTARIANYELQIAEMTNNRDTDILRQAELETYIAKHEALASDAATLIANILPPVPVDKKKVAPVAPIAPASKKKANPQLASKGKPKLEFTIVDIRNKTFPILRTKNLADFSTDDILAAVVEADFPGGKIDKRRLQSWLSADIALPATMLARSTRGRYKFKDTSK